MDPEAAYRNMIAAMKAIFALNDAEPDDHYSDDMTTLAAELAEAVEALDGWLRGGGFPPKKWAGRGPRGGR